MAEYVDIEASEIYLLMFDVEELIEELIAAEFDQMIEDEFVMFGDESG